MSPPDYEAMARSVIDGCADTARRLAQRAVSGGEDLLAAVELGFAPGIRRVGALWEEGEYFLPELVQGAHAMKAAMDVLNPALRSLQGFIRPKGRVVIGTVEGDLHDIGKGLVATLLEANGFEVHDLGSDVPVARFILEAREAAADIIAASALLTTTMTSQRSLAEAVAAAGFNVPPRLLIGGAPATPQWAASIGAYYAESAQQAVTVAEALVG